jgi:class 3 adenylate cyclase
MAAGRGRTATFALSRLRQSAAETGCAAAYPEPGMQTVPDPTVVRALTFLFADVEGSTALTDRRGECVYAGCPHYRKCFIERASRASAQADLVIQNPYFLPYDAARDALRVCSRRGASKRQAQAERNRPQHRLRIPVLGPVPCVRQLAC